MRNSRLGQAGFTLLETMFAMGIMLVAFSSILMVQSSALNSSAKARQMNVVGMLAKNKMVEAEREFEGKTFDEVKKTDGGPFPAPYEEYSWKKTIKEVKLPSLATAGDKKDEGSATEGAEMVTKLLTNYLSKSIREVTVTVTWKRGTGEQSFSLSTYWVNLNNEFSMSE